VGVSNGIHHEFLVWFCRCNAKHDKHRYGSVIVDKEANGSGCGETPSVWFVMREASYGDVQVVWLTRLCDGEVFLDTNRL
jgi:hypothetical protein